MTDEALKLCPFEALDDLELWIRELRALIPEHGVELCGQSARLLNIETWYLKEVPMIRTALEKAAAYDRIKPMLDELVDLTKVAHGDEFSENDLYLQRLLIRIAQEVGDDA